MHQGDPGEKLQAKPRAERPDEPARHEKQATRDLDDRQQPGERCALPGSPGSRGTRRRARRRRRRSGSVPWMIIIAAAATRTIAMRWARTVILAWRAVYSCLPRLARRFSKTCWTLTFRVALALVERVGPLADDVGSDAHGPQPRTRAQSSAARRSRGPTPSPRRASSTTRPAISADAGDSKIRETLTWIQPARPGRLPRPRGGRGRRAPPLRELRRRDRRRHRIAELSREPGELGRVVRVAPAGSGCGVSAKDLDVAERLGGEARAARRRRARGCCLSKTFSVRTE